MPCRSPDFHQKSFRIKHEDDKFFARLLSRETSNSYPSVRVYYGGGGDVVSGSGVPFTWETRPGTPKHPSCDSSLIPPLTPPPSYYKTNFSDSPMNKRSRFKLMLHTVLRRMMNQKNRCSSSVSSSSSSSSSRSLFYDPTTAYYGKRRRFASWGSAFDHRAADDRRMVGEKWSVGIVNKDGDRPAYREAGGFSMQIVKKALLSIVGRGSS